MYWLIKDRLVYFGGIGISKTNIYLFFSSNGRKIVIDSGGPDSIQNFKRILNRFDPDVVIITHAHIDHICGVKGIKNLPVYLPDEELKYILEPLTPKNILGRFLKGIIEWLKLYPEVDIFIPISAFPYKDELTYIDVGGHTPGSGCFYNKELQLLFTGDVLYVDKNKKVRVTANAWTEDKERSLNNIRKLYDMEVSFLLPGHGIPLETEGVILKELLEGIK